MTLDFIRVLLDFGFVVFIWTIQLVIYPSFKYYTKNNLLVWHKIYTKRVTIIVLPLMFGQLTLALFHLCYFQNWYTILSTLIILVLWFQTFLIFVPLHQSIEQNKAEPNTCGQLVTKNWMRTILWTLLFVISLWHYFLIH